MSRSSSCPYSPYCLGGGFCELRTLRILKFRRKSRTTSPLYQSSYREYACNGYVPCGRHVKVQDSSHPVLLLEIRVATRPTTCR